jgi:hypothetical protein
MAVEMPNSFVMILKHVDAMRCLLDKLERQVLTGDMGGWQQTLDEIREAEAWIAEEAAEAWAEFIWQEHKAEQAFYGKEVIEEIRRKREQRKRGAADGETA